MCLPGFDGMIDDLESSDPIVLVDQMPVKLPVDPNRWRIPMCQDDRYIARRWKSERLTRLLRGRTFGNSLQTDTQIISSVASQLSLRLSFDVHKNQLQSKLLNSIGQRWIALSPYDRPIIAMIANTSLVLKKFCSVLLQICGTSAHSSRTCHSVNAYQFLKTYFIRVSTREPIVDSFLDQRIATFASKCTQYI